MAALLSAVAARITPLDYVRHKLCDELFDSRWTKKSRIKGAVRVPVRVGLSQSNLDKGGSMLMEISHPNSERYGKHLSASELDEVFAPLKDRIDTVTTWLRSALSDRVITLPRDRQ